MSRDYSNVNICFAITIKINNFEDENDKRDKINDKQTKPRIMLVIIATIICGIITGRILRHRVSAFLPRITTALIWILLFLLGIEAGSNESVVNEFTHMGAEAFVITMGALGGSVLSAWLLWRSMDRGTDKRTGL